MKIYYGYRPTGCLAITAVKETAERFSERQEEAA
jgi:hypothetical protein